MFRVKREKGGKIHFATASDAATGNVTGWTSDESGAKAFERLDAVKVVSAYKGRKEAGKITAVPASAEAKAEAPVEASDPRLTAELRRLTQENESLRQESAELWKENAKLTAELEEAKKATFATPPTDARGDAKEPAKS